MNDRARRAVEGIGAHRSGAHRAAGEGADLTLYCETREKLARLYDRNLKDLRMILPPSATDARGPVRIRLSLPDQSALVLRGTISELGTRAGTLLRLVFSPLTHQQHTAIDAQIRAPTSPRKR